MWLCLSLKYDAVGRAQPDGVLMGRAACIGAVHASAGACHGIAYTRAGLEHAFAKT